MARHPQPGTATVPAGTAVTGFDSVDPAAGRTVPAAPTAPPPATAKRSRSSAAYAGTGVGLIVAILVIVFIVQNQRAATVTFLVFNFRLAEGITILASAVAGGLVVLLVSLARVTQMRRAARRHERAERSARI